MALNIAVFFFTIVHSILQLLEFSIIEIVRTHNLHVLINIVNTDNVSYHFVSLLKIKVTKGQTDKAEKK